jgi:Tumour necrosis factor receptor stn_TNFRSF12A_TNFR domain
MISKCQCQNCGGNVEFEASEFEESGRDATYVFGQSVSCSHCSTETILYLPKPPDLPKPTILDPPPAPAPFPAKLHCCLDCGHPISPRAFFCPHCGALPHVPFRIIWGVTCGVLFALTICGLIGALIGCLIEVVKDAMQ